MKKIFYSNGKLLITGEYLVLDGAKAFALPTKFGQNLIVDKGENQKIHWKSYDYDNSIWFEDILTFIEIINNPEPETETIKATLLHILHEAYLLNPAFLAQSEGYQITTQLTFPKNWGLGTSSTLVNNIAQWTKTDAFTLLKNSFGGSGYDIACAKNNTPILYQLQQDLPVVESVNFHPEFSQNIYFVYLNKKQSSKAAIAAYNKNKNSNLSKIIADNDKITQLVIQAKTGKEFAEALAMHEAEMSNVLKIKTVKERLFPDFDSEIKSLGAWGGDFVMTISKDNPTDYFTAKGYKTVIPYNEMILG